MGPPSVLFKWKADILAASSQSRNLMKRRSSPSACPVPARMAACGSQSKADACKEINNARDKAPEQWTLSFVPGSLRTNPMCSSPSAKVAKKRHQR